MKCWTDTEEQDLVLLPEDGEGTAAIYLVLSSKQSLEQVGHGNEGLILYIQNDNIEYIYIYNYMYMIVLRIIIYMALRIELGAAT